MKYIGAAVLAFLGFVLFPNPFLLDKGPAYLVRAGIGLLFFFFSYRAATHRNHEETIKFAHRPSVPVPSPRTESPPSAQARSSAAAPGGSNRDDDFPVSPTTPDIRRSKPVSLYTAGEKFLMFFENPEPVATAGTGIEHPLKYPFAASVFDIASRKTERLFTLEVGFTSDLFFCAFERDGAHVNFGDGRLLANLSTFEAAVLHGVCLAAGIPIASAVSVPL